MVITAQNYAFKKGTLSPLNSNKLDIRSTKNQSVCALSQIESLFSTAQENEQASSFSQNPAQLNLLTRPQQTHQEKIKAFFSFLESLQKLQVSLTEAKTEQNKFELEISKCEDEDKYTENTLFIVIKLNDMKQNNKLLKTRKKMLLKKLQKKKKTKPSLIPATGVTASATVSFGTCGDLKG